jgi:hypothetical protein
VHGAQRTASARLPGAAASCRRAELNDPEARAVVWWLAHVWCVWRVPAAGARELPGPHLGASAWCGACWRGRAGSWSGAPSCAASGGGVCSKQPARCCLIPSAKLELKLIRSQLPIKSILNLEKSANHTTPHPIASRDGEKSCTAPRNCFPS